MVALKEYQEYISTKRAAQHALQEQVSSLEEEAEVLKCLELDIEEARDIMSAVAIQSQTKTKEVIEELVSDVLQGVFGPEYTFIIEDVIQRNKPEMNFYVAKDDKKRDLRYEKGGSVCVLVAFALRVILCAITSSDIRKTIILDEPLKDSSKDKLGFLGGVITKVSGMLKIQFIIVTHEEELILCADRAFRVSQPTTDYSIVEQIEQEELL